MKPLALFVLLAVGVLAARGAEDVSGIVLDAGTGGPLRGASVVVKTPAGKMARFTSTKQDGSFVLALDSIAGHRLEVSMLNYERLSLPLDSVSMPLTVSLQPRQTMLREVTVRAERIRQKGDTISYRVGSFAQQQDRTIGDVLARMPGISVAASGKIQYQGEDINKFYIEGSDLLGGRYGIATNGISHEDVGAVEVMENHQPMQVLSGISFSDRAAINLKLKSRAKATWTCHGTAGVGYGQQPAGVLWNADAFAMGVMPRFQSILSLKTNNNGLELSAQATDFFASMRGTALRRTVSVAMPSVPNLGARRTAFNRSVLASANGLWKMSRGEVKTQIDYSANHRTAHASNITTYFLPEGNRVVEETYSGTDRAHTVDARAVYELNAKTAFVNNTLQASVGWDNMTVGCSGWQQSQQQAWLPEYYAANRLKVIKRFGGRHLVSFNSTNEWESLPQRLTVQTYAQAVMQQHIGNHAFFTNQDVAYTLAAGVVSVGLEAGLKGGVRSFNSELPQLPAEITGATVNVVNTSSFTAYAAAKAEYTLQRVNFKLDLPVSVGSYTFNKALADRTECYCSPALGINWKPGNRLEMRLRGSTGRSPMSLSLILPDMVMTDYRTFRSGVDNFYSTGSQNLSAHVSYKLPVQGLFANTLVIHSWTNTPYTLAQRLVGNYQIYSYAEAQNTSRLLMAQGNIGKTLNFMRGSANLRGSYTCRSQRLLSDTQAVDNVTTGWTAGLDVSGSIGRAVSLDYKLDASASRMAMNGAHTPWLHSLTNSLLVNVMPHSRWECRVGVEYYLNELSANSFKSVALLDTKLVYKLSRRVELAAAVSNVFNCTEYSYTTYSQLSSFESRRLLRGRECMLSITIKK